MNPTAQRTAKPQPTPDERFRELETALVGEFEPLNIDGFSGTPEDVELLSTLYSLLASYADSKSRAMKHRIGGDIEAALAYERVAESTYNRLPRFARW